MGHNWQIIGTTLVLGATVGLVSYQPAWAKRARDYTPVEFRSVLNGLGYNISLGDTLTDDVSVQAIREFQKQYGLPVDGSANVATQDLAANLVTNLQASLNLLLKPNPPLPRSQYFGPQTELAVRQFQQRYNLPVTGIATLAVRQEVDKRAKEIIGQTPQPQPQPPNPTPVITPGNYNVTQFLTVLYGLGYNVDLRSNSLSDPLSQQAIRDFQREYELTIDGIAGADTQKMAFRVMRTLHDNLNNVVKPNPPLIYNGQYDAATESAVRQFQRQFNLPVTGIASIGVRKDLDLQAKKH